MTKLSMYCMALNNDNLETIKSLNYIPVGLKNNNFSNEWLRDNTNENISEKNPFYGEYTFIIGIGKIYLNLKTKMIGLVSALIENIGDQKIEINQITLGI